MGIGVEREDVDAVAVVFEEASDGDAVVGGGSGVERKVRAASYLEKESEAKLSMI